MTGIPVVVEATTRQFESWKGVAVIAETLGSSGWALAGGQMVAQHLLMADLPFPRVTLMPTRSSMSVLVPTQRDWRPRVLLVRVGWGVVSTTSCTASPRRPVASSTFSDPMAFARSRSPSLRRPRCSPPAARNFSDARPVS